MKEYVKPKSGNMTATRLGVVPFALGVLAGKAAAAAVVGAASAAGMAAASKMMSNDFSSSSYGALKPIKYRGIANATI